MNTIKKLFNNTKQAEARRGAIAQQFGIRSNQNYKRISNGDVLSGCQVLDLLEIANPTQQAMVLMDISETADAVTVDSF